MMFPPEHPVLLAVIVIVNWPIYVGFLRLLFDDSDDVVRSLGYLALPELLAILFNRSVEESWAELRLILLLVMCVSVVVAQYCLATWLMKMV